MDELKEMLYCELDEMTKSGELTVGSLKTIGDILDAIKDISTIEAMEEGYSGDEGNSMSGRYYRDGYARENSMRGGYYRDGSYEGNSYARKRNRMGQFSRYSREGEKDQLVKKLETLMNDTTNGGDRQEIVQKVMGIVEKYK